jgi:hypothetical protein
MQARMVNTIYWATDDPLRPKSYDRGVPVRRNGRVAGDLLMVPGPLALRWGGRLFPRLEIGELAAHNPVSQSRVQRWLDVAPRIAGDIVIKLFAHGAREDNAEALLGGELDRLFTLLEEECARRGHKLHYATAWETYLMIDAIQNNSSSPQK